MFPKTNGRVPTGALPSPLGTTRTLQKMSKNCKCSNKEAARGRAMVSEAPVACSLLLKANCVFYP